MKSGKTFVTEGGNFYTKQIVHLPYHDDENKLESAFEDGIVQADSKHCTSCLLYFTENSKLVYLLINQSKCDILMLNNLYKHVYKLHTIFFVLIGFCL